ncbi:hypothetical protein [Acinetobacter baumannii]|uniref:hypothetical protein n=1 Tax=Acinetobacter baumannii TaxID=470 RepID=UPI00294905D5|nr:hypothetical protein [Acinetobacter baumannii]MDV5263241.1 hypothetical protein [Acinetobacter baumannii]
MLKNIVQTELKEEKTQLKTALLKVSQMPVPKDYSKEIGGDGSSLSDLKTGLGNNDFGQELDRLATEIRKIRPKPKPATDFEISYVMTFITDSTHLRIRNFQHSRTALSKW